MKHEYEVEFEFKWWHIILLAIFVIGCGLFASLIDLIAKPFRKK